MQGARLWAVFIPFAGQKQGAGWEVGLLELESALIWDPNVGKVRNLATRLPCWAQYTQNFDEAIEYIPQHFRVKVIMDEQRVL